MNILAKDITAKSLTLLFMLSRLPYLILEYPACIYADTDGSIRQFFGFQDSVSTFGTTDPNNILTNHTPVIYTILHGGTIAIGNYLGSQNVAVFAFVLLQALLTSYILAKLFMLYRPEGKKSSIFWKSLIGFTALFPIFGFWSTMLLKDAFYAITTLLLIYAITKMKFKSWQLFLVALLYILSKNQCVYIIAAMCLVSLLYKGRRAMLFFPLTGSVLTFEVILNFVFPLLHIAPSGLQESHGFMFQQTALYMKAYPSEITADEKKAISALLPYDSITSLYDPAFQDPLKFKCHKSATTDDYARYRSAHVKMMMRHPEIATKAMWDESCEYFYPSRHVPMFDAQFDIYRDAPKGLYRLERLNASLSSGTYAMLQIPPLGILFDSGFYVPLTLLCIVILLFRREWKKLFIFIPIILSIAILTVSPVNNCFRYVIPIVYCLPFILLTTFCKMKRN